MSSARREAVAAAVAHLGEASLSGLAAQFGVSEMTIRRDLEALELAGVVRRVRGGAIPAVGRYHEPHMVERSTLSVAVKSVIGVRRSGALLGDGRDGHRRALGTMASSGAWCSTKIFADRRLR